VTGGLSMIGLTMRLGDVQTIPPVGVITSPPR